MQWPAPSGQLGTNWASQSMRMTLIKAPESEVFTDHELMELSSSASMLLELDTRDKGLTAVTRVPVQYSITFHSSYNVSF